MVRGAQDELLDAQLSAEKLAHINEKVAFDLGVKERLIAKTLRVGRGKVRNVQSLHTAAQGVLIFAQVAAPCR